MMFRQFYQDTGTHHPSLLNRPLPRPDCIKYLEAFQVLGGHVSGEEGPKGVSVQEINAYADGIKQFPLAGRGRSYSE